MIFASQHICALSHRDALQAGLWFASVNLPSKLTSRLPNPLPPRASLRFTRVKVQDRPTCGSMSSPHSSALCSAQDHIECLCVRLIRRLTESDDGMSLPVCSHSLQTILHAGPRLQPWHLSGGAWVGRCATAGPTCGDASAVQRAELPH